MSQSASTLPNIASRLVLLLIETAVLDRPRGNRGVLIEKGADLREGKTDIEDHEVLFCRRLLDGDVVVRRAFRCTLVTLPAEDDEEMTACG